MTRYEVLGKGLLYEKCTNRMRTVDASPTAVCRRLHPDRRTMSNPAIERGAVARPIRHAHAPCPWYP
eukprot:SAG31_NODE_3634_length_4036_cov_10.699517_3_plen_67_part_00